ncbi:hypothetical protein Nepgr_021370 [Nepenthes gracilis]|uniref:Dof zinc finger protein n=1 Tax=Nepenthes gracilis TaxID=150966 RepID=A0AAD3XWZ1_NEPGR|nr:hypothetical protein Nepgr_021370 [Nepenthes gracilis]
MASAGSRAPMEKPTAEQIHQQLKCPRCQSTNTKFCYYNNYSLSQPRHFCKACKRHWTRGGALRNVPVGGGCRKIKSSKRRIPAVEAVVRSSVSLAKAADATTSTAMNNRSNPHPPMIVDVSPDLSNHMIVNSQFYGLSTNPSEVKFPLSRYDLQPYSQLNNLGIGLSSGFLNGGDQSRNGFNPSKQIIQDLISPNSLITYYNAAAFGGSSSSSATNNTTTTASPPVLSSSLASSLQRRQKFTSIGLKDNQSARRFQTLSPHEDFHSKGRSPGCGQYRPLDGTANGQNLTHQTMVGSSDPSVFCSGTSSISPGLHPSNIGPSLPSLI